MSEPPVTPDGRYLVVRGRLWRRSDPRLSGEQRRALVDRLMAPRRAVGRALRTDAAALPAARAEVDAAKIALGERGPVWWDDDAPDLNRRMARNTVYAGWYAGEAAVRADRTAGLLFTLRLHAARERGFHAPARQRRVLDVFSSSSRGWSGKGTGPYARQRRPLERNLRLSDDGRSST